MKLTKKLLAQSSCALISCAIFGNCMAESVPSVTATSDSQQLMNSLFSDPINVENVKITGNQNQIGVFSGAENLLDMKDGVVLSTGFVSETFKVQGKPSPWGPNMPIDEVRKFGSDDSGEDLPDITGGENDYQFDENGPTDTQSTEDKDVEKAAGNKHSYDSISLEFDAIPNTNKIKLQYVYASSEWQRVFNNSLPGPVPKDASVEKKVAVEETQVADYVAPDDTAMVLVNGENVAKVPTTGAVLSAKNILEASGFDTSKPAPDPDIEFGSQGLFIDSKSNQDFGFLGRSKLMESTATLIPNEINHIKLAVSDLEDPFYNTAFFIKIVPGDTENRSDVNPKTGDINLGFTVMSTLASTTALSVLVNKMRKK